jgi:uncharacterized membrane protein YfcA
MIETIHGLLLFLLMVLVGLTIAEKYYFPYSIPNPYLALTSFGVFLLVVLTYYMNKGIKSFKKRDESSNEIE